MSRPDLSQSLQFADPRHRALLPRHKVQRFIRAALELPGEIAVRIVDAEEGRALNRDYRAKDYATNVLTFDYAHEPVVGADEGDAALDHLGDRGQAAEAIEQRLLFGLDAITAARARRLLPGATAASGATESQRQHQSTDSHRAHDFLP